MMEEKLDVTKAKWSDSDWYYLWIPTILWFTPIGGLFGFICTASFLSIIGICPEFWIIIIGIISGIIISTTVVLIMRIFVNREVANIPDHWWPDEG